MRCTKRRRSRKRRPSASQALYFLNWLHYYGARLYDGAQRKELLEKAQRGFSEFAVGDRRSELLVESLLGRGLTNLELGNTEYAVHDLQAVANDPQASAERKSKARLALLDAQVRAGNVGEALRLSDQTARQRRACGRQRRPLPAHPRAARRREEVLRRRGRTLPAASAGADGSAAQSRTRDGKKRSPRWRRPASRTRRSGPTTPTIRLRAGKSPRCWCRRATTNRRCHCSKAS